MREQWRRWFHRLSLYQTFWTDRVLVFVSWDANQKSMLEEEFTIRGEASCTEANEVSTPGPSGKTITFFNLLFMTIPIVITPVLNYLVFVSVF